MVEVLKINSDKWMQPDGPGIDFKLDEKSDGGAIRLSEVLEIAIPIIIGLAALTALCLTPLVVKGIIDVALGMIAIKISAAVFAILLGVEAATMLPKYVPEAFREVANVVNTFVKEIFAILSCAVLYPVSQTWFDPKKPEDIDQNQVCVLLVHGYLHNSSGWLYHRYRYNKAGINNVFTVNLGHPFHSIEEYAEVVKQRVEEIKALTGKSNFKMVGHSMGGLVSAYYATNLAEGHGVNVSQVITLGSPLNGTKFGYVGVGECSRQMRLESEFLPGLQDDIKASDVDFFHLGSKTDEIIRPTASAIIKENNHFEFDEMGHVVYLFSDRVIDRVIVKLNGN